MKKQIKWITLTAVLLSMALLVACGNTKNGTAGADADSKDELIATLEEKVEELEADNLALKEENEALKIEVAELKAAGPNDEIIVEEEEELPVFGAEEDGTMTQVFSVVVKTDEPLLNKMQILGDALSAEVFEGLSMDILDITTVDGKDILHVDLKEGSGAVGEKSWIFDYFQGSTGGQMTETALLETFLQREYGGLWIDGVKITLDGETIQFDHVPTLADTVLR